MFEQKDLSFIYRYFIAEKQESLLFLIVGIVAVLLAVVCWFFIKSNPSFFKGAAMPLLAIGLIQIVVGYSVYTRTDKQKAGIAYNIGIETVSFVKQKELPRMKTVMKNFVIYRWVEIVFILTGLLLIFLFKSNPDKTFWYGFGVALAMQAVIMLGADYFAEQRGKIYNEELQKMIS
jgi:4-amino-4-deoxy-L-arabinose transferase-like glycosyltransferase